MQVSPSKATDPEVVAVKWRWRVKQLRNNFDLIGETDGRKKTSLMLQVKGPELQTIIECLPETKGDNAFEAAVATLDEDFIPQPDPIRAC